MSVLSAKPLFVHIFTMEIVYGHLENFQMYSDLFLLPNVFTKTTPKEFL